MHKHSGKQMSCHPGRHATHSHSHASWQHVNSTQTIMSSIISPSSTDTAFSQYSMNSKLQRCDKRLQTTTTVFYHMGRSAHTHLSNRSNRKLMLARDMARLPSFSCMIARKRFLSILPGTFDTAETMSSKSSRCCTRNTLHTLHRPKESRHEQHCADKFA